MADEKIILPTPEELGIPYVPYSNPTPGELPIMGVGKLPNFTYFDSNTLNLMREAGLNIAEAVLNTSNEIKCSPFFPPGFVGSTVNCPVPQQDPNYHNIQLSQQQWLLDDKVEEREQSLHCFCKHGL